MKYGSSIRETLADLAPQLGFEAFGIASVAKLARKEYFLNWLSTQQYGEMHWLAREPERRVDPALVLEEARSLIVVGMNYFQPQSEERGKIATYALGNDYHAVMEEKLKKLAVILEEAGGRQKCYVDTGPVMEKNWAELAGLGWQGKSTMLIHPRLGTWLFLGCILTTLELEPDSPGQNRCGTCTRCMAACPTNAIIAPYQLDARRCIAYLTIEHQGFIPEEFRQAIGDRLYGCDDCLTACPWNRWAQKTREAAFQPLPRYELREMLSWTEETFRQHFRHSPIKRLKLLRWKRNICIVLGNIGNEEDIPVLKEFADKVQEEWLKEHACWAIVQIEKRIKAIQ